MKRPFSLYHSLGFSALYTAVAILELLLCVLKLEEGGGVSTSGVSVLVIAEHDNNMLRASTLSAVTAALLLNDDVSLLVMGYQCDAVVATAKTVLGVKEVLCADSEVCAHFLPEVLAPLVVREAKRHSHVLAPATTFGKNIMPRVAALLDVGQVSDVIQIVDDHTYERPIYAGNAIATVVSHDAQQILTVRTTAFSDAALGSDTATVVVIDADAVNKQSVFVSDEIQGGERPELTSAEVVIAGGRGLGDQATFDRLTAIADKMGAAMGASRAAVDAGLAPNDWQVGQTGQVVAPTLYIAVGISGAIQHLAGMKDSQKIVAINKDPEAPIFQVADYGLVADLKQVLPEWEEILC
jgi:electron transfer flavoprotein alpha subunit